MRTTALLAAALLIVSAIVACDRAASARAAAAGPATAPATQPAPPAFDARGFPLVDMNLPKPFFGPTPKDLPPGTTVDMKAPLHRPPFYAPRGTRNLALNQPVTSSDSEPIIGALKFVTDGDKEGGDGSYVELAPGLQWVQIDLGTAHDLWAIVVWHYHATPRVYRDVVVQVSDDRDFITGVTTLFNNDQDNTAGLGIGTDREYFETYEGKLIEARQVKARYVRCYSKGSTDDGQNHYIEVEAYGLP